MIRLLIAALTCLIAPSSLGGGETASAKTPGHMRMLARLDDLEARADPEKNPFLNTRRAELFLERVGREQDLTSWLQLQVQSAVELIQAGKTQDGVDRLRQVRQMLDEKQIPLDPSSQALIRTCIAIGCLRLAEEQNCCARHTPESCIVPLRGAAIHQAEDGSRGAIEILTESLQSDPKNLTDRWLLNLAYMTLGEYPDKVPPELLVPPSVFESAHDIQRFPDVAGSVGLDVVGNAGGVVLEDQDGDGDLDLMVSSWGLSDQLRYFRNDGNGRFTERTNEAGLDGEVGGLNLVHADYDNDGDPDVLVLRGAWLGTEGHHPNSLLRNDGDGTYTDVTEEAGLLSFHPTQTAAFADFDNDGWLDLFIGNESRAGDPNQPCELFHSNRDGTFTECAARCGITELGFVKGVAFGDYDNDGRPDLYLSRLGQPNLLYRNDGPKAPAATSGDSKAFAWSFTEVGKAAGVTGPVQSFPTWFFDYDNDGWLDLMVFSYDTRHPVDDVVRDYLGQPSNPETSKLYRNNRDGTFTDVCSEVHLQTARVVMGSNFGDLDNDGFLDIYIGTGDPDLRTLIPNRMYRNAGGRTFQDVTTSGGFGHLQKGHGIAFGDVDRDGDQDIYAVMGGAYEADVFQRLLFMNPGHGNHWLTLELEGVTSNRSAIGARVKVVARTADGVRMIHSTVSTGGSFGSAPLERHIGLGSATGIESVTVTWPTSGRTQTFSSLEMDRMYRIREDQDAPVAVSSKPFALVPAAPKSGTPGAVDDPGQR